MTGSKLIEKSVKKELYADADVMAAYIISLLSYRGLFPDKTTYEI